MASNTSLRRRIQQSVDSIMTAINTSDSVHCIPTSNDNNAEDVMSEQHSSNIVNMQMLAPSEFDLESDSSDGENNSQSPTVSKKLWENWRDCCLFEYNSDEYVSDSESSTESLNSSDDVFAESVSDKLAKWAVLHSISLSALDDILKILKPYHKDLPATAKSLLKTPSSYEIRKLGDNEQYYHFGINNGVANLINANEGLLQLVFTCDCLTLQFNIDGLPLFKSSSCELWPILCMIKELSNQVFIVGLYCGRKKPSSLDSYLKDFVDEIQQLVSNGIMLNETCYPVKMTSFVCDAPARAYLKNVKSHTGYFGCDKCKVEGEHINNKMTFLETDAPLRQDADFINIDTDDCDEHHRGQTPLSLLPIGLVSGFVMDYMHLVCLGVMRRLLNYWLKGPPQQGVRLPASAIQLLSIRLSSINSYIPREFARRPRSLNEVDRFKATEYRQLLLYTGPVVFRGILSDEIYNHFMLLSVGISLLSNPKYYRSCNRYANDLLVLFVKRSRQLYGKDFVVYNVHGLVHLAADAENHGCLDSISAFPYENYLKSLKNMVRKAEAPLPQIVRRLSERQRCNVVESKPHQQTLSGEHYNGPVPDSYKPCQQFKRLKTDTFFITHTCAADNCVVVRSRGPALVRNIVKTMDENVHIVCQCLTGIADLFEYPLPSRSVDICKASGVCAETVTVSISDIIAKCVCLPCQDQDNTFAVIPLLHL